MPERARILNVDAADVQKALRSAAQPYPFGGRGHKTWVTLAMSNDWWSTLERAITDLDDGRIPQPLGARRPVASPHQVLRYDNNDGQAYTWSPGAEERARHAGEFALENIDSVVLPIYARGAANAQAGAAYTGKYSGTAMDVMVALYSYVWLENDQTSRDMLEQWLDELGLG